MMISVLLGSVGLVVQRHFCQNELKSISVFLEAEACHEKRSAEKSCPFHPPQSDSQQTAQKNCCNNDTEVIILDEDYTPSTFELGSKPVLIALISLVLNLEIITDDPARPHYFNYKPPLLVWDHSLRFQTFLC